MVLYFGKLSTASFWATIIGMVILLFLISAKWTARALFAILGLLLLAWLLIQTDPVQNFLIGKATAKLSKELHTEVRIKHVSLALFDKADLNGTLIKDRNKDTLLYAGAMKLRITDWFFFRDKIDLTYVGLEDAVINMRRSDSVWNYQFLVDYFTVPKASDTAKGIELNIQKVDFKNVNFLKHDEWIGQNIVIRTGSLLLDADKIDLVNNSLHINSIELDKPYFRTENFEGKRKPVVRQIALQKDTGLYFNAGGIDLAVGSITITNGYYATGFTDAKSEKDLFNGRDIEFKKINGSIKNFSFIEDTIRAQVKLNALERSGFEIRELKSAYRLTPQLMEFDSLDLKTNKSHLTNYVAFRFTDFNRDFADFTNKVKMEARFRNATINTDDISFFAPELKTFKQNFIVSGNSAGVLADLTVKDLFIRSSANTYVSGNLHMKGLPDIEKTAISLTDANVQTNSKEIAFLYPGIVDIKSPNLAELGNVHFTGNYTGSIRNFNVKGNMATALGNLKADIILKLAQREEPYYQGTIATEHFNLGKFFNNKDLGNASFDGSIDGYSFTLDKLKTTLTGNFNSLEFLGYNYTNLDFNGVMQKQKFNGDFKADDPNFSFTSTVEVDLSGKEPRINVLGDLALARFQNLKLTKDKIEITGLFDLNFEGSNIDEFIGSAKILNATLLHDDKRLSFDSLTLGASIDSANRKVLSLNSNEFDASITGEYNILDLPNGFQSFLSHYYYAYIKPPKTTPKNQQFVIELNTRDFDKYAKLLDSNISGFNDVYFIGAINTKTDNGFFLDAKIPFLKYKNYSLEDAKITGKGTADSLYLNGDIGRIYVSDSMYFPNTILNIKAANDHSVINLSSSANITLNDAKLNADVFTLEDGVRIEFQPSAFVLNDKQWNLENKGELVIRKQVAIANNVKFTQGFSEISVETEETEGGSNSNNLVVKLKKVNLGDIMPMITRKPVIEGVADGSIYLRDFYGKFRMDANLQATQFRMDNDSVGVVNISGNYNSETGKAGFKVKSDNDQYLFDAEGYYNTKDSSGSPLLINTKLNNTKIDILNQFLGNIFSDITGYATGDITVRGPAERPHLLGKVHLHDAGLLVNYTQVYYSIDSASFTFRDDGIDFGEFTITDKLGNKGFAKGKLYEEWFQNLRFDFDFTTPKLLLVDTKAKDNQQFYGRAIGRANLSLKGPQENMKMTISGEVNDTSHIFIPTSNSKESADADYIVFKQYGTEMKASVLSEGTKLSIDMDLIANNQAQIDVILDELTGDVIQATGNGRIQINVPASGNMSMKGRYNIEGGKYNFNFQSLAKRPFDLVQDAGSYIEWNGNPYDARINIAASYTAKAVSLGDLVANSGYDLGGDVLGYKGDVYVIANLTDRLSRPKIDFSLNFPDGSPVKNNNNFDLFLKKLENDQNEMLKQVTWLIVFNSFSPYGTLAGGGSFATSTGINTISQALTGQINKLLSSFLVKTGFQLNIGAHTYSSSSILGTQTGGTLDRQTFDLRINKSLLDGKVIITFGGDFDFNLGNTSALQSGTFQWLPDISAQIVLSKDKKLRAIIFNKSNLDISSGVLGRRNRQGVSISYTRDYQDKLFSDKPRTVQTP